MSVLKSSISTTKILFSHKRKEKLSDEEVVKIVVIKNSHDDFGILYDRYSEKVYHKCISFVKDLDLAQDLTHDIFLKTFLNLSKFNFESRFSTWLYSITYNFCIDFLRKNNKVVKESDAGLENIADDDDHKNEEELLTIEAQRLGTVLDSIGPNDKMLLLMKYQDELSVQEIMAVMDLKESAVKMRIKRARAKAVETYKTMFGHEG